MIPAQKIRWLQFGFHQYNTFLLKHRFHRILVLKHSLERPPSPALFIMNHSSWWDGIISIHLNRYVFDNSGCFMMHESGMKRFPFFRYLGAFTINRSNPKDIIHSLHYACERLQQKESIWLFPQGDEKHLEIRPLSFLPGFVYIIENNLDIPIVPVSYYYSFGHHQKPDLYIAFGEPLFYNQLAGTTRRDKTKYTEELFTNQLNSLKTLVVTEQLNAFVPLKEWRWNT
ncbi:lysophospholipid acyltransferase family protein [Bacillus sp. 165]|uniref:lysophospholipid acyltransferase family protein n=1 Tax=Bacillus sp. 165 TaxID=1529117 RepID=UPI001ADB211B|nr:lysophospholipid acyltransferase family protein [Bacillus sp. 165]MBO9128686.1 lysophospholipid acyltransferase family protein [Bacillus sp. 165]